MGLRERLTWRRRGTATVRPAATTTVRVPHQPAATTTVQAPLQPVVGYSVPPPVAPHVAVPGQSINVNLHPGPAVHEAPVIRETPVVETVLWEDDYVLHKLIQAIWFLVGFFEIMLAIRFLLRVLAANPDNPFAVFVYSLTAPLVWPFATLLGAPSAGGSVFEWNTIFAMLIYWLLGWLITKLVLLVWDRPVVEEYVTRESVVHEPVTREYVGVEPPQVERVVQHPVDHHHTTTTTRDHLH